MLQRLEKFDFPHGSNREAVSLRLHPYPFQRNMDIGDRIPSFVNLPKGSLANLAHDSI